MVVTGFVSEETTELTKRMSWFCQDILVSADSVLTDLSRSWGLAAAVAGLELGLQVTGTIPYVGYGLLWPKGVPFQSIVKRINTMDMPGGTVEPYKRQTARDWVIANSDITYSYESMKGRLAVYPVHVSRAQNSGIDTTAATGLPYAPTWKMVRDYKAGKLTESEYTDMYVRILDSVKVGVWRKLFAKGRDEGELVFSCYCRDGEFCHTYILMKYLVENYQFQYHPDLAEYMEGTWI